MRAGVVHETRLAPGPLCEDAEERAGNDTAHGAVWSQLSEPALAQLSCASNSLTPFDMLPKRAVRSCCSAMTLRRRNAACSLLVS